MHQAKLVIPRLWLLTAMAAVVAAVGLLPMFGGTAYAAGLNANQSAGTSQFTIPGTPLARTTAALNNTDQPPFNLTVNNASPFPTPPCAPEPTCQIIVSDGAWGDGHKDGIEIMTYDSKTATSFHITQRGPQKIATTAKKTHPIGSKVKVATTTTAALLPSDGPQSTMTDGVPGGSPSNITATQGGCTLVAGETYATCPAGNLPTPFAVQLASTAGWPATAAVSIGHQDVQTSNLLGGQSGEYMRYDMTSCGALGANQICIIQRALQPSNRAYIHRPTGYAQPSQTPGVAGTPGVTEMSVHFLMSVKSNAGFFPAGNLLVCDPTNPLTNCELIGHNNAATKIVTPTATQFYMHSRCASAAAFNNVCDSLSHGASSIVTGADGFLRCRNGSTQPGVDTNLGMGGYQEPAAQVAGTSIGSAAVCYAETQPKEGGPSKPPVIAGNDLLALNSIQGQPFLSTGGFCHVVLGPVGVGPSSCPGTPPAPFDTDGSTGDANDCDGDANTTELLVCTGSACIVDFTPGINLQVNVRLDADKVLLDTDTGTINVVLDAITGPTGGLDGNTSTHDDCDDASGTDTFESTTYDSATGEPAVEKDDDTDRDGCTDERELRAILNQGGLRDPWNPYDWYDINHDGAVSVPVDILQVAQSFGVPANYRPRKDRGALSYGPFSWDRSAPDNAISVPIDVLGVSNQFSSACLHDPNTMTTTHETYDTGSAWPAGNRPWYMGAAGDDITNHGPTTP
jgi:hypothetical protein